MMVSEDDVWECPVCGANNLCSIDTKCQNGCAHKALDNNDENKYETTEEKEDIRIKIIFILSLVVFIFLFVNLIIF